jgi:hypothetical protein
MQSRSAYQLNAVNAALINIVWTLFATFIELIPPQILASELYPLTSTSNFYLYPNNTQFYLDNHYGYPA